jgi:hypothetical protein
VQFLSPESGYLKDLSQNYNEERNKKGKLPLVHLDLDHYCKIKERFKDDWKEITSTHSKWSVAFGVPLGVSTISPSKSIKSIAGSSTDSSDKENELPDTSYRSGKASPLVKNHVFNALLTVI